MYIEMCIPSSFNKTNEKKRKERRKNSKNQHQDLGLIKKIVCFPLQSLDKKVFMQLKYEKFIG